MACPIISVELIVLAVFLEFLLMLVDLFRRRALVIVAKDANERASEVFRVINWGHG